MLGDTHLRAMTHLFSQPDPTVDSPYAQPILSPDELDDPEALGDLLYDGGPDYRELAALHGGDLPRAWLLLDGRNFSARRERLCALAGWDDRIDAPEEAARDLARRLHEAGVPFRYVPEAVAIRQDAPADTIRRQR